MFTITTFRSKTQIKHYRLQERTILEKSIDLRMQKITVVHGTFVKNCASSDVFWAFTRKKKWFVRKPISPTEYQIQ